MICTTVVRHPYLEENYFAQPLYEMDMFPSNWCIFITAIIFRYKSYSILHIIVLYNINYAQ